MIGFTHAAQICPDGPLWRGAAAGEGGCAQLQARFSEVLTAHTLPTGLQLSLAQALPGALSDASGGCP